MVPPPQVFVVAPAALPPAQWMVAPAVPPLSGWIVDADNSPPEAGQLAPNPPPPWVGLSIPISTVCMTVAWLEISGKIAKLVCKIQID